jgi:hypothetical protein
MDNQIDITRRIYEQRQAEDRAMNERMRKGKINNYEIMLRSAIATRDAVSPTHWLYGYYDDLTKDYISKIEELKR